MFEEMTKARDLMSGAYIEGNGQNFEVDKAIVEALEAVRAAMDKIAEVGEAQ